MEKIISERASDDSRQPQTRITPSQAILEDGDENLHTWGFSDTQYLVNEHGTLQISGSRYSTSGQELPYVLPWFENHMAITFPRTQRLPTSPLASVLPPPIVNEAFLRILGQHLSANQISEDASQRLRHCHGHALQDMSEINYGSPIKRIPDLVLYPENADQVQAIVQAAKESNVCLLPVGGGTNVSRALSCPANEGRTIAAVSTRRMHRVLWIDKVNQLARIESGAVGRHINKTLASHGMSLGHEPDSVEFSTLGGWIATNASGMKKNRYGNIEDIVLDVEIASLDGLVARATDTTPPRESIGLDTKSLIFGSEGSMGIITSAVVKIFPLPEVQRYGSILFRSLDAGLDFINELERSGDVLPASVRLVDNTQFQFSQALKPASTGLRAVKSRLEKLYVTRIRGYSPESMVACTLVYEGTASQVRAQQASTKRILHRHGGMAAGSANGQRGYEMTFAIAYIRDFAMSLGILAESFETSCDWSSAAGLMRRVKLRVHKEHAALGLAGRPFISSRVSQVYHTGVCIYFYLAVFTGDQGEKGVKEYEVLEEAARDEILLCGGSLSHHHGIGNLRRKFLGRVINPATQKLRDSIKKRHDGANIFLGGIDSATK